MHNTLLVLLLSIPYVDFMSHQGTMAFRSRGEFGLFRHESRFVNVALEFLPIYQLGGTLAGIVFLVLYGLQTHWYMSVAMLAIGLVGRIVLLHFESWLGLLRLEGESAIISLVGLVGVPLVLWLLFYFGNIRL